MGSYFLEIQRGGKCGQMLLPIGGLEEWNVGIQRVEAKIVTGRYMPFGQKLEYMTGRDIGLLLAEVVVRHVLSGVAVLIVSGIVGILALQAQTVAGRDVPLPKSL